MSQLAGFVRQVDQFGVSVRDKIAVVVQVDHSTEDVIRSFEALTALKEAAEKDLLPTEEKLQAKLGQADPVTGNKRFGQQSIDKFVASVTLLHETLDTLAGTITSFKPRYDEAISVRSEQSLGNTKEPEKPALTSTVVFRKFATNDEPVETEEQKQLRHAADEVRARKANETDQLRALSFEFDESLHQVSQALNENCLYKDMGHFTSVYSTQLQSGEWRTMQRFLLDILWRIISKPDDVNLRKLRGTHPAIQEKLTHSTVGVALLVHLGFQCKIVSPQPVTQAHSPGQGHAAADYAAAEEDEWFPARSWMRTHRESVTTWIAHRDSPAVANSIQQIIHIIGHSSSSTSGGGGTIASSRPWDVMFDMAEPSIEGDALLSTTTTGTSSSSNWRTMTWIEWYDRLQASVTWLETTTL